VSSDTMSILKVKLPDEARPFMDDIPVPGPYTDEITQCALEREDEVLTNEDKWHEWSCA